MIFIRIAIAFFIVFLFGKIVDFTRGQQEKCESISIKLIALGILNALLVAIVMISTFAIISGTPPTSVFSYFSICFALFLGIEFSGWISSDRTKYRNILVASLALAILFWPTFYGVGYLVDLLYPEQILLFKVGVVEFSIIAFFSTISAPTIGRYL